MRLIIGAGGTSLAGWLSLERGQLDIREAQQWARLFKPNSIDAILAEHVLEHLTMQDALKAMLNCFDYLKPRGYLRLAVPDGNNPDEKYRDWNAPEGSGQRLMRRIVYAPDEPCHQVFYNVNSLSELLSAAGFTVRPLEFYDVAGRFHANKWSRADGEIRRSYKHPYLFIIIPVTGVYNTSLIVDAVKVV
jgi:predicted SAM-dependent methyltransferase